MNQTKAPPSSTLHQSHSSESSSSDTCAVNKEAELLKFTRCFTRLARDPLSKKLRRPFYVTGALYRYTILFLLRSTVFTTSTIAFFSILPLLISLSANKAGRALCKLYCKALMFSFGIKLINHGTKPDLQSPHVFVANHTSFLDYIVLAGHKFPHACIMARHKGLIGWLQNGAMTFLNSTAFDREDRLQRQAIKAKLTMQLNENPDCKLLVFPESTCVNNQYIVRFQKGVFDLDADTQICPVAIRYGPETPRSTVFDEDEDEEGETDKAGTFRKSKGNGASAHVKHESRQHRSHRYSLSRIHRHRTERRHKHSNGEDDHGWRKDLMHVSSAETTEGEEEGDEAHQNGWRKDLFRISDDDDDQDKDEANDSDKARIERNARPCSHAAATQRTTTTKADQHDWNAVDPYWDTRQSLWQQLFYLMTRWKLETHVHYLRPQTRRRWTRGVCPDDREENDQEQQDQEGQEEVEEDPVHFANRIRCDIAKAAQLKVAEFNGRDKKRLLKLIDQQQQQQQISIDATEESTASNFKRSSSARSMDEGYGSSLRLNSLAMTSSQ